MKVQGKNLIAGKYGLHTILGKDEWTIIFNSVWKGWGSNKYKESNDVLRVNNKTIKFDVSEQFTIKVDKKGTASLMWDTTKIEFTIN